MEPLNPVVFRRRTLTNSAAEYVERRAGKEALLQLEGSPDEFEGLKGGSEFVTEFDRFVPKGFVFDSAKCYEQSKARILTFRRTLQNFVTLLKERKVDSQLNIVLKDPSEFTVEYIIQIINRLGESSENPSKTKSCKNFVQKCHRKVKDNKDIVEGILNMIPNDIYGSVISGGVTLILAAVEKQAKQREAIQSWLAEIPEKLETIQRLSEIHHASIKLHSCADDIIVAIFTVLERVVEKITRTWKGKSPRGKIAKTLHSLPFRSKLDADGAVDEDDQEQKLTVPDALDQLQKRIENFQKEVDMCEREKLGRVEKTTANIESGLVFVANQNVALKTNMNNSLKRLEEMLAGNSEKTRQMLHLYFEDALYRFCASNPNFNAKTGEIDREEVKLLQQEQDIMSTRSRQEGNSRIASKWLTKPKLYDPIGDMKDCLEHVALLEPDEKNISHWILNSEEHSNWLRGKESSILEVQLQTPPASLNNPLSFTSALTATTLFSTEKFPVLAYFCMHRNNESILEEKSGPIALTRSLNSQLLKFIADNRPLVDLSSLGDRKYFSKARKTLKHGLQLFDALFSLLTEDDMVFVIVDSLSRLSGSTEDGDKVMKKLKRIIEKREELTVKVVVTDALAGSYIKNAADISLYVRDVVSGYGGFDIAEGSDKIAEKIKHDET
ncbi:hypothetical protein ACMFMG_010485 [Clarireedia jacksonii]